jgi:hypothetical protein
MPGSDEIGSTVQDTRYGNEEEPSAIVSFMEPIFQVRRLHAQNIPVVEVCLIKVVDEVFARDPARFVGSAVDYGVDLHDAWSGGVCRLT